MHRTHKVFALLKVRRLPQSGYYPNLPTSGRKPASGGEGGPKGLKRLTSWSGAQALLKKSSRVGVARPLDKVLKMFNMG